MRILECSCNCSLSATQQQKDKTKSTIWIVLEGSINGEGFLVRLVLVLIDECSLLLLIVEYRWWHGT